jgi:hypothetical protein
LYYVAITFGNYDVTLTTNSTNNPVLDSTKMTNVNGVGWFIIGNGNFVSQNISYNYNANNYSLFNVDGNSDGVAFSINNGKVVSIGGFVQSTPVFNFERCKIVTFENIIVSNFQFNATLSLSVISCLIYCNNVQNFTTKSSSFSNLVFDL